MRISSGSESNFNDPISTDDRLDRGRIDGGGSTGCSEQNKREKWSLQHVIRPQRPTHLLLRLARYWESNLKIRACILWTPWTSTLKLWTADCDS